MKTIVHANQEMFVRGPCKIVYSLDKPLSCGAKVWIETEYDVEVIEDIEYGEIAKQLEREGLVAKDR